MEQSTNEGQRQLRLALAERGAARRLATELGVAPAYVSRWLSGSKPDTSNRVALNGRFEIPILAWDADPTEPDREPISTEEPAAE